MASLIRDALNQIRDVQKWLNRMAKTWPKNGLAEVAKANAAIHSRALSHALGVLEKSDKEYNGWTNYETWAVNLWLTNDSVIHEYWREAASEELRKAPANELCIGRHPIWPVQLCAKIMLANKMKKEIGESMPDLAELWSSLCNSALCEVDWLSIAEFFLEP